MLINTLFCAHDTRILHIIFAKNTYDGYQRYLFVEDIVLFRAAKMGIEFSVFSISMKKVATSVKPQIKAFTTFECQSIKWTVKIKS